MNIAITLALFQSQFKTPLRCYSLQKRYSGKSAITYNLQKKVHGVRGGMKSEGKAWRIPVTGWWMRQATTYRNGQISNYEI